MAKKIRFNYDDLESEAEGVLDTRGRKGLSDVPVHYQAVRLKIKIKTDESQERLQKLIELVKRYCPVDSLVRSAVPDYQITWEYLR